MRRGVAIAVMLFAACAGGAGLWAGGLWAAGDPLADQRHALATAKREAASAAARAERLGRLAARERGAAARAAADRAAVEARIESAGADVEASRARVALADTLLAGQRARLAEKQGPVAHLLAALQSLTARPAVAALAQPGTVDDLVHVRAVLAGTLPVIRARTIEIRTEIDRSRAARAEAAAAAGALRDGEARLRREREALAALELTHGGRADALARVALVQSDKAIALGETARDIVDRMDAITDARAVQAQLLDLPGPPADAGAARAAPPAYRLPVGGRLVTGLGEVSDNGVRSRGLTLAVRAGAAVAAPAAGTVLLARPFRGYGGIVILDHGAGWTTLITGLDTLAVRRGQAMKAGVALGRAANRDDATITVELRRQGRPMDIAALTG